MKVALFCLGYMAAIVVFVGVLVGAQQLVVLSHQETVIDTVIKSERVVSGESSKYLVFGKNEVYQNTDMFVIRKFNSSDFHRDIQPGKTYRFTVAGWRVPLFSWYRNIIRFEEVVEYGPRRP